MVLAHYFRKNLFARHFMMELDLLKIYIYQILIVPVVHLISIIYQVEDVIDVLVHAELVYHMEAVQLFLNLVTLV